MDDVGVLKEEAEVDKVRAAFSQCSVGVRHTIERIQARGRLCDGDFFDIYALVAQDLRVQGKTVIGYSEFRAAYGLH